MCLICVELEKERITASEALKNFREMEESIGTSHADDVLETIWVKAIQDDDKKAIAKQNIAITTEL